MEFNGTVENFKKNGHSVDQLSHDETDDELNQLKNANSNKTILINNSSITRKEGKETEELIAQGFIKMSVYSGYIRAGGFHRVFSLLMSSIVFVISVALFDYGLVGW